MIDYEARMRESKLLIEQGLYTQAVRTLANVLENLYTDFYQELVSALPPRRRQQMTDYEQEFTSRGDRAAQEHGFSGLTLGGKAKFYRDYGIVKTAEEVFDRELLHFSSFDPRAFNAIRIASTHGADAIVSEDEAQLFYSQMRVLLLETGRLERVEPRQKEVDTGGLHSWKESGVVPHKDILEGKLEMHVYAADLWGVARRDPNTEEVYRDAKRFFRQTYLTKGMERLLYDVLSVLDGKPGDRVLQLRTPFGGGKTHSLIALFHVTNHRDELRDDKALAHLPDPGNCAVAAIQCEKFGVRTGRVVEDPSLDEPLHIRTLWGEVAYQLAGPVGYEYIRAYDEGYTAPGGEELRMLLRDIGKPVLILLDEVLNHVENAQSVQIGESTLGRQVMSFLKNLTEEVSRTTNGALVYSLQASIGEALGAEKLLADLDHLVSRIDAKREPVTSDEVVHVVQRRLFSELPDEHVRRDVAAAYAEASRKMWMAASNFTPDEQQRLAQEANRLAERIVETYPFHPDLPDLMYHRWGTLPSYQRTRGALQFLASTIYDLWNEGRDLQPLIGPGDVPLAAVNTRNAFFTQIGQREAYSAVLDADISGTNARVRDVDAAIAADSPVLQRFKVGTRLATAIMLYSFGAREGEERGIPEPDLLRSAVVPGLDRMSMTTALNDLRQKLLYLHHTGRRYRFETQYNLNKLIDEETKSITSSEVNNRVRDALERELRDARGAVVWPTDVGRISDRVPRLQIAYLTVEWAGLDQGELEEYLDEWLNHAGNSPRVYKNGVVFALPGYVAADIVFSAARETLAIENMIKDKRRYSFNPEQFAELKERGSAAVIRLERGVLGLYEKLAVPVAERDGNRPYTWRYPDLASRSESTLHARSMGALQEGFLAFESLKPDKLVSLSHLDEAEIVETGEVVQQFYSILSFTRLMSAEALRDAISQGVRSAKFGYTAVMRWDETEDRPVFPDANLVYFDRPLRPDEIDLVDAYIIDAAIAEAVTRIKDKDEETVTTVQGEGQPGGQGGARPGEGVVVTPGGNGGVSGVDVTDEKKTRYRLIARATKENFFKMVRALQNLGDQSDTMEVGLDIYAAASDGYDPVWLRNAVEEPLDEADIMIQASQLED